MKKRKRPIYRKAHETYYKIYPNNSYLAVEINLFGKSIRKSELHELNKDMKCVRKIEFIKRYRQVRNEIRL